MILGLFWVLLLAAAVSGVLGFFILTSRRKGLAKAMFYLFLCGAAATGFVWLVNQPPETVLLLFPTAP
ncbi:MAG TPA: hypothetical protein VGR35_04565 [Tepidisphaeraceae bacterium]|nr:hypothetical protein [Tepidisphaeraceae bacterium]